METLTKRKRRFYPENLKVNRWRTIKKEFLSLLNMPINSPTDLENLIQKSSEGIQLIFDHRNRLFMEMKSKTSIYRYLKFVFFQKMIIQKGLHYHNQWETKIDHSPFKEKLDRKRYGHLLKIISQQRQMYVKENDKLIARKRA